MSFASPSIRDYRQPRALGIARAGVHQADRWFGRATWAFVAIGILLRLARYLMNYPLWWDEAFVAVNFIRRDYFDLLRPLDYGQVCPILFLWCELAVVKLLGFSEWSLRLFPLVCATASVVLFRHVTARIVCGLPLLMAVAIFATSFHPIVHAADVKPYASDLMAALVLLAIAVEWLRAPERAGWMWVMAAVAPLALAFSHPAIFVVAGTIVGLAPAVAKARQPRVGIAYCAFTFSALSGFLFLFLVFTRAQAAANLTAMQTVWFAALPPLDGPFALIKWLVKVHTGSMFAYPCGGERGASSLTLLLFALGAGVLWYRHRRVIVLVCLAPFGLAILAAAIRRYPYGGPVAYGSPARVMQYLAPGICLLAGTGAAVLILLCRDPHRRYRVIWAALISLALVGIIPLATDTFHPYRAVHAQRAREFARQFWPEFVRDAEPVCLRWDLGIGDWNSTNLNVAVYLCNQMIYSPQRWHPPDRCVQAVLVDRPLRCVSPLSDPANSQVAAWLGNMKTRYRLVDGRILAIDMAAPGGRARIEHYAVYEFVPRERILDDQREEESIGIARTFPLSLK